jgi:hypothetical protein
MRIPDILNGWFPEGRVPQYGHFYDFSNNPLYSFYNFFATGDAQNVPLLGVVYSFGIVLWVFLLLAVYVLYRKRHNKDNAVFLIPLGLVLFYFSTLFLGPVALMRYVYPMTIILPFVAGIVVSECKNEYFGTKG